MRRSLRATRTAGIRKEETRGPKSYRYYDPQQFERVRKIMKEDDPLTYLKGTNMEEQILFSIPA